MRSARIRTQPPQPSPTRCSNRRAGSNEALADGLSRPEHRRHVVPRLMVPAGVLGGGGFAPVAQQVISSVAYTNGLAWRVMQSHPMGYSQFTFGYWSQVPGSLSSFGVNTGNGGGQ